MRHGPNSTEVLQRLLSKSRDHALNAYLRYRKAAFISPEYLQTSFQGRHQSLKISRAHAVHHPAIWNSSE